MDRTVRAVTLLRVIRRQVYWFPARIREFSLPQNLQICFAVTQSTAHSLPVANSPTANQPEPETDDSPTSTAEDKEKRN